MTRHAAFVALGTLLLPPNGLAGQDSASTEQVTAELIPETRSIRPGGGLAVAIRLRISPGWHIYWHNPGQAGLPTRVAWELPDGLAAREIRWPYPERLVESDRVVHAYRNEVVLLGGLESSDAVGAVADLPVSARLRWAVCREVCIPQEARLTVRLEETTSESERPEVDPRWAAVYASALSRLPHRRDVQALTACRSPAGLQLRFAAADVDASLREGPVEFFPDDAGVLAAAAAAVPEREGTTVTLELAGRPAAELAAERVRGVLVWHGSPASDVADPVAYRVDAPVRRGGDGTDERCARGGGTDASDGGSRSGTRGVP